MKNDKIDPLIDINGLYSEISRESPRAAVIISAAFLDAQLRKLISLSMINDKKAVDELLGTDNQSDRPLSSFGSRIKTAYCMGLISKSTYDDLELIKRIRNKFAHKLQGYTFDEPEIVTWCKNLKLAKELTDAIPKLPRTNRNLFIYGVTQLEAQIEMKIVGIEKGLEPFMKKEEELNNKKGKH